MARSTEGEAMKAALAELLRLYDWRFELARMERDGDCPGEMTKLLNQYGREKKAAWAVARALLTDAAPQAGDGRVALEGSDLIRPAVAAQMRAAFEKWLDETMQLQSEWQEERNCYKDFAAHLAWKAWNARPIGPGDGVKRHSLCKDRCDLLYPKKNAAPQASVSPDEKDSLAIISGEPSPAGAARITSPLATDGGQK